jgi:hypothetical protein
MQKDHPLAETALVVAATSLPLAAGLAVVLWSRFRAAAHDRALLRIDGRLNRLYAAAAARPVPAWLAVTLPALEEHDDILRVAEACQSRTPGRRPAPAAR